APTKLKANLSPPNMEYWGNSNSGNVTLSPSDASDAKALATTERPATYWQKLPGAPPPLEHPVALR
ncbi:hypothetical protein SK128_017536, partial [Halocaridina rubra]